MDSSTSSGDDQDGGATVRKLVVMIAIMGETTVLREGPMVLLEANEVVLLCHEIQIIMPHRILIMEAD